MESNEFKVILSESLSCGCCFEDITLAMSPTSLIYFQDTIKVLPWFASSDLSVSCLAMNSSFASILTKSGILFLIPLSSISGDQFLPAWRKFILKSFHTYISQHTEVGMLDSIGGCLAGRDHSFENYLELSMLKVNSTGFTGMVWSGNFLIISANSDFFIINTNTGLLQKKKTVKFNIRKIELIDTSLLVKSDDCYYIVSIQDLTSEKVLVGNKVFWEGRVFALAGIGKISVANQWKLEVFTPDQYIAPIFTLALPKEFDIGILWRKCVVGVTPGVTVMGKVPLVHRKKLKYSAEIRVCACGQCKELEKEVDYEEWIKKDKESCALWTCQEEIGTVTQI